MSLDPEIEAKYEVLAKMGEGGMGSVYKVRHRVFGEIHVIKTTKSSEGPESARFINEAKRGRLLRHKNIAEVFDFAVTSQGTAYIVMEFIDGLNLRQVLVNTGRSVPAQRVIDYALQTLEALDYLGTRGVVHRDISPDNLMLTSAPDGSPLIKLIDLGIAKSLEASQQFTMAGKFIGKFHYASPEQIGSAASDTQIDARSDLYSLGVVMYELLTGALPFRSKDLRAIMMAHVTGELLSFDETDPDGHVPFNLRAAVVKALRPDVDDRYQSAREFADALKSLGAVVGDKTTEVAIADLQEPKMSRSEQIAWEKARAADSPRAFDTFLEKYPQSQRAAEAQRRLEDLEKIEESDWSAAQKSDTVDALNEFLVKHPESGRSTMAKRRIRRLEAEAEENGAFDTAAKADTAIGWEQFIRNHPDAKRLAEAQENLAASREREAEARAWTSASNSDTAAAWRDYVGRFPRSPRVGDANQRLATASAREDEARDWTVALSSNTVAKWSEFIKRFPASPHRAEADAQLAALLKVEQEQRAFATAQRDDTVEAWEEYLRLYAKSARAPEAKTSLAAAQERDAEHRDWIDAGAIDTVDGWRDYIAKHPESSRIEEARRRLLAAKRSQEEAEFWAIAEKEDAPDTWRGYLAQFGKSHRAAEGRKRLKAAEERVRVAEDKRKEEETAFATAKQANTVEGWDDFIRQHPSSPQISAALKELEVIQARVEKQRSEEEAKRAAAEEQAWIRADHAGSIDAYERFIKEYPSSRRAAEAQQQIDNLRATIARDEAVRSGTDEAYEHFLETYPRSRYAKEIHAKLDAQRAERRRVQQDEEERERVERARKAEEERAEKARIAEQDRAEKARRTEEERAERARKAEEESAWAAAKKRNKIAAFEEFIRTQPSSPHVVEAKQLIETIQQRERDAAAKAAEREREQEAKRQAAAKAAADRERELEVKREAAAKKARDAEEAARAKQIAAQVKTADTTVQETVERPRIGWRVAAAVFVIIAALVIYVVVSRRPAPIPPPVVETAGTTATAPAPSVQTGQLQINAYPWGQVISIRDRSTQKEQLAAGQQLYTPATVSLPVGSYTVTLFNPNSSQRATRDVTISATTPTRCEATLDTIDPNDYLARVQQ